jgi:hypothetical protein
MRLDFLNKLVHMEETAQDTFSISGSIFAGFQNFLGEGTTFIYDSDARGMNQGGSNIKGGKLPMGKFYHANYLLENIDTARILFEQSCHDLERQYGHLQGAWLNSMNVVLRKREIVGSLDPMQTAPYAWHVIYGTKPAENAKNLPPGALVPWVEKKLGLEGKEAERVAFLIGRKIARHGRKGNRFISPIIKKNYRLWKRVLEESIVRAS